MEGDIFYNYGLNKNSYQLQYRGKFKDKIDYFNTYVYPKHDTYKFI